MDKSTLTVRDFLAWKFPGHDIDAWASRVIAKIEQLLPGLQRVVAAVCKAAIALHEMPPSPGYEPLLIERGQHPLVARMLSYLLIAAGEEEAAHAKVQRKVVDAIRFLAKPGRTERAISRKAALLLGAWNTVCGLKAFDAVGISVWNFESSLEAAVRGDQEVVGG